ncbi:MAG: outer membrane lipoprotein chaperone LolA [Gammaproteobacteria bacterium]
MNRINLYSLIVALLLTFPVLTRAEDEPVNHLKSFLANTKSLSADFKQVLLDEAGRPMRTSFGSFYLQRPGKFRWDYIKPFSQQIISDAGKVWFYDTDLEQVTVKKVDESLGSTPALLLSGEISLDDNFIMAKQGSEGDMQWIKLLPKSEESSFKYILIGLTKDSLGGMELSDNFGQLTRIYFSHVILNPPLKATLFQFKAPKGVDVFSDE